MSEVAEFVIPESGAPRLEGQDGGEVAGPEPAPSAAPLAIVPAWTEQEAAKVVGGLVANITLALYAFKHKAPPAAELWPLIAGQPEQEFPLLGAGLAPVLDFLAPKGSAAAVGVSLTAGAGELIGAFARRAPLINTPPQQGRPGASPSAPAPSNGAAAGEQGNGFRFSGDALRVLQREEGALVGMGID